MSGYLSSDEVAEMGFASVGDNVLIHRTAIIVNPELLSVGSNIRIDAFSVITCGERCVVGDHVHVSTHVFLAGRAGFELGNFSGLSSGVRLFTTSDDFSGDHLTNPTFSEAVTNVVRKRITIGEHAVAGANSVMLPGGALGEGTILGSMSLAKSPLEPWQIYAGVPAKRVKERSRALLNLL